MIARHSALVSTRAPDMAHVLEVATDPFFLGAVGSIKNLSTGLLLDFVHSHLSDVKELPMPRDN